MLDSGCGNFFFGVYTLRSETEKEMSIFERQENQMGSRRDDPSQPLQEDAVCSVEIALCYICHAAAEKNANLSEFNGSSMRVH
jgi:hypothetical protein